MMLLNEAALLGVDAAYTQRGRGEERKEGEAGIAEKRVEWVLEIKELDRAKRKKRQGKTRSKKDT